MEIWKKMWVGVFFLSTVYISAWNGRPINYVFVFDSRRCLCLFVQFSRIAFWWARNVMPMYCIVLPVEVRCTTFWERFTGPSLGPITDRRFLQQTRTTTWHYRTAAFRTAAAGGSPPVHSSPRTLWIRSGTAGQTTAGTIWRTLAWWSSCSRLVKMKSFGWPLLRIYCPKRVPKMTSLSKGEQGCRLVTMCDVGGGGTALAQWTSTF